MATGSLLILDTDVLIDFFRGVEAAQRYIRDLPVERRATTDVTRLELYRGARNARELRTIERFLSTNFPTVLPISTPASRMAVELIKRYALSHGLSPPDALIAAIALNVEGTLISGNYRDFACVRGLKVQAPPYRGA